MRNETLGAVAVLSIGLAVTTATRAGGQVMPLPHRCSLSTLHGPYGMQWVGTRPVPSNPAQIETFTGVAIRTFDGAGTFTQVSNVKGVIVGLEPPNIESVGTYEVNRDCSGTAISQFVPGAPPVTARFVIVDDGAELLQSVMTPASIFNAGVIKKIHKK